MTENTVKLINEFVRTRAIHLLPSIIIGMQEEDNVSDTVSYKNCFRLLRNLAAHEPGTLTTQIKGVYNAGNQKIVFVPEELRGDIVVDLAQFTLWMMDMYKKTGEAAYIKFAMTLMQILMPYSIGIMRETNCTLDIGSKPSSMSDAEWATREFLKLQNIWYESYGLPKTVNVKDDYFSELLRSNPKLFWKIAVPNMMWLLLFLFYNTPAKQYKNCVDLSIEIFRVREGLNEVK